MSDYSLRGKCLELAELAVSQDPELTLVRGWYWDASWGRQEHWWAKRADGSIVDPTAAQFPSGGIPTAYEEFTGSYPCEECGVETLEEDLVEGRCCSSRCYGRMVGLFF